jgi:trimethylguanosine synthase
VRRRLGTTLELSSRQAIEQALDQSVDPQADVSGLKDALRRLLAAEGAEQHPIAKEVSERVCAMTSAVASKPVVVTISGWPEWMTVTDQMKILGHPVQALQAISPAEAALLHRELDGLQIGGSALLVQVGLGPGERLPAVPRGQRARPRARGTRPWLPFLDAQGRYSLTPEALAREHAEMLAPYRTVIDPFCGCGGDAIAMAQAGLEVFAVESCPERLALAQKNAEACGVAGRIHFIGDQAERQLPTLTAQHPEAAVYLDPPWGGVNWDRDRQGFDELVPAALLPSLAAAPQVLLKAPRALDPETLPDLGSSWRVRPAWNPRAASPAERLIFLRAIAKPS